MGTECSVNVSSRDCQSQGFGHRMSGREAGVSPADPEVQAQFQQHPPHPPKGLPVGEDSFWGGVGTGGSMSPAQEGQRTQLWGPLQPPLHFETGCCLQGLLRVPQAPTLLSRWIPFFPSPGQTRVSCLTGHPFTQHHLLRACPVPGTQAAGKTDVTLLSVGHTPGPRRSGRAGCTGPRGGCHEQVDLVL